MSTRKPQSIDRVLADVDQFLGLYVEGAPCEKFCELYGISPQTFSQTVVPKLKKMNYISLDMESVRKTLLKEQQKEKYKEASIHRLSEKTTAIDEAHERLKQSKIYDQLVLACNVNPEDAPSVLKKIDYPLFERLSLEQLRNLLAKIGKEKMPYEAMVYKAITPHETTLSFCRKMGTARFNEEQIKGVEFVLNRMPYPCGEVLKLHYVEGLTFSKTAKRLGLSTLDAARKYSLQAAKIMNHPQNVLYIKLGKTEMDRRRAVYMEQKKKKEVSPDFILDQPLEFHNFSTRTYNSLRRNNCSTLRDISSLRKLKTMTGIGEKSIQEVVNKHKELNLELKFC